jgi:hypothetical protein
VCGDDHAFLLASQHEICSISWLRFPGDVLRQCRHTATATNGNPQKEGFWPHNERSTPALVSFGPTSHSAAVSLPATALHTVFSSSFKWRSFDDCLLPGCDVAGLSAGGIASASTEASSHPDKYCREASTKRFISSGPFALMFCLELELAGPGDT